MITKLEEVEQYLFDNNIEVIADNTIHSKAFVLSVNDAGKLLVYAPASILNDREKREIFIHELLHLQYKNGMYHLDDCIEKRRRIERMVERNEIKRLIPLKRVIQLLERGYDRFEMADEFEVTDELMSKALVQYENAITEHKLQSMSL